MTTPHETRARKAAEHFSPGWKGGPGDPDARRVHEYRLAMRAAVRPSDLADVVRAMIDRAKDGDTAAARLVCERILGKARQEDAARVPIDLPAIDGAESVAAALGCVVRAVAEGRLDAQAATRVSAVLEIARRTTETAELERRIKALEHRADD